MRGWTGLCLLGLALGLSCSDTSRGGPGDDCFRADDCGSGLVCIEGSCDSDLTKIGSMVPGPEPAMGGAAGAPAAGGAAGAPEPSGGMAGESSGGMPGGGTGGAGTGGTSGSGGTETGGTSGSGGTGTGGGGAAGQGGA